MEFQDYLAKMKEIQIQLLNYIEKDQNSEENYQNIIKLFDDKKIRDNKHELKSILNLLLKISNNHHRGPDFFNKLEQILRFFKNEITANFSNFELFCIFKENKRILLFLIEEKMMSIDKNIANTMQDSKYLKDNYPLYFFPEIQPFIKIEQSEETDKEDKTNQLLQEFSQKLPENFEEKRKLGENDNFICQLIRNDSIKEFNEHIENEKLLIDATTEVEPSIYETNQFLTKSKKITLIEYAAFFGSIQIFKSLFTGFIILNQSLWLAAVHSNNLEMIHFFEENYDKHKPKNDPYVKSLKEAIKCHHNEFKNYLQKTFLPNEKDDSSIIFQQSLKYYNFAYVQSERINESLFIDLCNFDYYPIVEYLLKTADIDINQRSILNLTLIQFQIDFF